MSIIINRLLYWTLVSISLYNIVAGEEHCDFSFGDPEWHAYVFYNRTHYMRAGTDTLHVVLPRPPGAMVSWVCAQCPALPPASRAAFSPLTATLTLSAPQTVARDTAVRVVAKEHGYVN